MNDTVDNFNNDTFSLDDNAIQDEALFDEEEVTHLSSYRKVNESRAAQHKGVTFDRIDEDLENEIEGEVI